MKRDDLKNSLIVSCQPVPDGPMDTAEMVVGFALAALGSGATALRIESAAYVTAVRAATSAPIIGIVKRDLDDSPVRITPWLSDVEALCDAGADIIAFDATLRERPVAAADLIAAVRMRGRLTMADCASIGDATAALAAGADFVGTTLSGYVGGPEPVEPDLALIAKMRALTPFVIAEGRIRTIEQAAAAARTGAYAVVVGSAITRTEHVTSWFRRALDVAYDRIGAEGATVLAIDIGGTKILAGLVDGRKVSQRLLLATARDKGPDAWIDALAQGVTGWKGQFHAVGVAVTGLVQDGLWSALNPETLGIPANYPLVEKLRAAIGVPVFAANDAQAAAWGEYRFGAGDAGDMVFLTISTGVGGGVVVNGRPLLGLAGHFGLLRSTSQGRTPLEDQMSGRFMAAQAQAAGKAMEAPDIFAAARAGEAWADTIVDQSATRVALLCQDIQLMFDPRRIVIGGGIGLADGFLDRVRQSLSSLPDRLRPVVVAAKLGGDAGIIGIADLATGAGGSDRFQP